MNLLFYIFTKPIYFMIRYHSDMIRIYLTDSCIMPVDG